MMRSSNRSHFASALAGVVAGVVLLTAVPVFGAAGDDIQAGRFNDSGGYVTRLKGKGNPTLRLVNWNGRPALELRVAGATPPMAVNSTGLVDNLNADMVDGRHANGLLRVAYDNTTDAPDANGPVARTTIVAPGPGFLVVAGSVNAYGTTIDVYKCRLLVDAVEVPGSRRTATVHFAGVGYTRNSDENCSTTAASPVGAGSHTVALAIRERGSAAFYDASVWALYVPFDGTGANP